MPDYKLQTNAQAQSANLTDALQTINRDDREAQVAEKARALGLEYVNLSESAINSDSLSLIPHAVAEETRVVVFMQVGKKLRIALEDPTRLSAKKLLRDLTEKNYILQTNLASQESIDHALEIYAEHPGDHVDQKIYEIDTKTLQNYSEEIMKLKELSKSFGTLMASESINQLIVGAVRCKASDIHFQPAEGRVDLFLRIDGIMQHIFSILPKVYDQLKGQMKHDAKVKINVDNIPQDGQFTIHLADRRIDVRLSTLPTKTQESIVLRLLDSRDGLVGFDALGFDAENLELLQRALELPYGMVLVTGPTGSGKTTTLYALLNKFNTGDTKIITLEDPIEYHLEGITQSEIDEKTGFTFGEGLRAVLRQDPDIIMVGEIRDQDTAQTAAQAALTGHIMLSTIHTNSALDALPRLINLDVKPFILAPALSIIIAQRLVRTVCPFCTVEESVSAADYAELEALLAAMPENIRKKMPGIPSTLPATKGCEHCGQTGFLGRTAVVESLEVDATLREMILESKSTDEMLAYLRTKDWTTLQENGIRKVLEKKTTLSELIRSVGLL